MLQLTPVAGPGPVKPNFAEMIFAWGRRLAERGAKGSLAYRFALGFACTARGADLAKLSDADLLFFEPTMPGAEAWTVKGAGRAPEAWWIHATAFGDRGSAVFAFLAEGNKWAEAASRAGAPSVRNAGNGPDASVIESLESALGKGNLVSLPGVGALGLGSTADDAGLALLECRGLV